MGDETQTDTETTGEGGEGDNTKAIRIPAPHGKGGYVTPIRTPERARELSAIRWSKYRASAAAEVARAVAAVADADDSKRITASMKGDVVAYGLIAGKLAERAYVDADPRSAQFVRSALGADTGAPSSSRDSTSQTPAVSISLSADAARALAGVLAALAGRSGGADADTVHVLGGGQGADGE